MSAPVIEVDALTKSYGQSRGIEEVTFSVEAGEVFGFLRPNGAGKTTTIRALLDLHHPSSGSTGWESSGPGGRSRSSGWPSCWRRRSGAIWSRSSSPSPSSWRTCARCRAARRAARLDPLQALTYE